MNAAVQWMKLDRRRGVIFDPKLVPPIVVADINAWADFVRLMRTGGWGGGGGSSIWSLMQQKRLGIHSTGTAPSPEMNGNVAAVDRGVSRLQTWQHKAFTEYWLEYSTVEGKCRACGGISEGTFYTWLTLATEAVATYVTAWRMSA